MFNFDFADQLWNKYLDGLPKGYLDSQGIDKTKIDQYWKVDKADC